VKKTLLSSVSLFVLATLFAFTLPQNWAISNKYNISFTTSGVSGIFKTFNGSIVFDDQNPTASKFDVAIDVASINTGNGMQNKHAKSAEWFDAAKYPSIRFVSKKLIKSGTAYLVTGDLQMHGVTKELSIPFQFKKAGNNATFEGIFNVNRTDFGIGQPGGEVGNAIKLIVSVPVIKK
jgi:polyisoprenoid-binding protein YceI